MWEQLEAIFQALELDYSRQGSYESSDDYPASFFTFFNVDTPEAGFFDNLPSRAVWTWQIYYYTSDPSTLYSKMDAFLTLARAAGFIPNGKGYDIPCDRPDYVGRTVRIKYIQNYEKGANENG